MEQMDYLCLGISIAWLVFFSYLFILDRQMRQLKRRLDARDEAAAGS